ncbi:FIVAR domain-containing protein, partial [Blautia wexlerae]|nr:FIVAR domain-containing protein [Blautia wexlerae]
DALNENGYTPASWATLQTAADEARELIADPEPLKADVDKAYKALKDALMNLVEANDREMLQYYFDTASGIDLDLYLEAGKDAFRAALANAEKVLNNADATQEEIDDAASTLSETMANLLLIPNKDALKASVEKAETVDTSKYTAASVRTFQKALDNARSVLNNPQATEQQVQSADKQLTSAQNALAVKNTGKSSSKTTRTAPANTYGAEGTAAVGADVAKAASVVSDTTVNFTLKRGSAYCFKMTVVNGSGQAPSFTVGNGDVLKTQFVAQIGNVYYYRVWAVGAPGASAGVYTTLNRQPVKHCTVTIG